MDTVIVIAVIIAAVGYVVRFFLLCRESGCAGGCAGCRRFSCSGKERLDAEIYGIKVIKRGESSSE